MNTLQVGTISFDYTRGHVCNCIGCCRKCGGCRTDPRHAEVCDRVALLNAERERIYREASK